MILCKRCIQAIQSRGEKVIIDDVFDETIVQEDCLVCEWCEEDDPDLNTELYSAHFAR